ncbi:Tryptophan N-monooxygenase 2 [Zea mays]|uniref:Tryptophan N-monooxygenase 2 n=1 Tax=Zea mays TaxID=4577 RepID=A0A1D6GMD8_MAIZE|nr:Tryptophan N-monooxygenase 2 [Zea mays]
MALAPSHALVVAPFTALCAFLALALLFLYSKATSSSKKTQQLLPPGPAGLPIIGSLHCVVSKRPVFRWIHGLLKDMDTNVLCLRFGAVHVVVVACPETAREVLRTNDAVLASRPETVASALFSFGYKGSILTPYGEQWKKMRRVLSSEILSASMEQRLQRRRAQEADYLVGFLYSQCSASAAACCCSAVDVRHVARHFCGNMIRTLVFGKRHFSGGGGGGGPGPEEVTHMDALFTLLNYVYCFSVSDYVPAAWTWMVAGDHKKVAESVMETLSRPEVMHKAMEELDTVVGKDRLVQEPDIPRLNYLKACVREAFRLHPYHAFNPPHVATEDAVVSGYLIPKGSHVLLSRVGLGRNPDVWDAPLQFRPERHLMMNENDDVDDRYHHVVLTEPDLRFISFSAGRRGCPGVSLGSSVTMMLFARLLQGFTWTKPPGVRAIRLQESSTSLALAEPLLLQAQPRLPVHLYASG